MGVLIDTSILIDYERGVLDVERHIRHRSNDEFFLSVVTASELLHGVHRATVPKVRARRAAFVEGVLNRFPLLTIDMSVARNHAQMWADLARSGQMIGAHDMWLAATCLAHGLVMVTSNAREFGRVPGLQFEAWM